MKRRTKRRSKTKRPMKVLTRSLPHRTTLRKLVAKVVRPPVPTVAKRRRKRVKSMRRSQTRMLKRTMMLKVVKRSLMRRSLASLK